MAVSGVAAAVYISGKQSANKSSLRTFRQVTLQKICQFQSFLRTALLRVYCQNALQELCGRLKYINLIIKNNLDLFSSRSLLVVRSHEA